MSQEDAQTDSTQTRVATDADLDGLTSTFTAAFRTDPLWGGWAFPDPDDLAVWWRFYIQSALRYPCVWVKGEYAAASIWIPPDGTELTEDEEARVESLVAQLVGGRAAEVVELLERFEACHPRGRPHYYLSLLATHPDHRGRGLGMALLGENLAGMDAERMPTYLESTNPRNTPRYERLGFRRVGEFTTPDKAQTMVTMWRDADRRTTPRSAHAEAQPNVAAVEAAYEAFARGGLERFLEHWTDDLDHRSIEGAPDDRGPIHGRLAMRAYVQDWIDVFDNFRIEPVELIDVGENTVVAVLRFGGHAKLSGVETDQTFGIVFSIRDGRIARGREYPTRDEALEAAGLSE